MNRPARAIPRTAIAAAVAACALGAAQPGHGAPADTGLLTLDLDERASRRLDNLEKGEVKITWRRDGPVLRPG